MARRSVHVPRFVRRPGPRLADRRGGRHPRRGRAGRGSGFPVLARRRSAGRLPRHPSAGRLAQLRPAHRPGRPTAAVPPRPAGPVPSLVPRAADRRLDDALRGLRAGFGGADGIGSGRFRRRGARAGELPGTSPAPRRGPRAAGGLARAARSRPARRPARGGPLPARRLRAEHQLRPVGEQRPDRAPGEPRLRGGVGAERGRGRGGGERRRRGLARPAGRPALRAGARARRSECRPAACRRDRLQLGRHERHAARAPARGRFRRRQPGRGPRDARIPAHRGVVPVVGPAPAARRLPGDRAARRRARHELHPRQPLR